MKIKLLFILIGILNISFAQNKTQKISQFKWKIEIPEQCTIVKSDDWLKEKNEQNVKKGYKLENEENSKIVLVVKIDSLNYFIAYEDLNFKDKVKAFYDLGKVMFEMSKIEKVKTDHSSEKIEISKKEFNLVKYEYVFPNESFITTEIFGAYINKKAFSAFLMYNDKEKGKLLLDSFKNSEFK